MVFHLIITWLRTFNKISKVYWREGKENVDMIMHWPPFNAVQLKDIMKISGEAQLGFPFIMFIATTTIKSRLHPQKLIISLYKLEAHIEWISDSAIAWSGAQCGCSCISWRFCLCSLTYFTKKSVSPLFIDTSWQLRCQIAENYIG